jgi:hypothetical protein
MPEDAICSIVKGQLFFGDFNDGFKNFRGLHATMWQFLQRS